MKMPPRPMGLTKGSQRSHQIIQDYFNNMVKINVLIELFDIKRIVASYSHFIKRCIQCTPDIVATFIVAFRI